MNRFTARFAGLFLLLCAGPAMAFPATVPNANGDAVQVRAIASIQDGAPYPGTPLGFQNLTSLSASTALTVPAGATYAVITAETQAVRWRDDGVAPTATVGFPLPVGGQLVYAASLATIRFIQQTAAASIDVSYYK